MTAVLLAAGLSKRMGRPKMLLDWGGEPMIRAVARTFLDAPADVVRVVTGAFREEVESALQGLDVRFCHNPDYEGDMLQSIRVGIAGIEWQVGGMAWVHPADHPLLLVETVRTLMDSARARPGAQVVRPLSGFRRGHPVGFRGGVARSLAEAPPGVTLRDVLGRHASDALDVDVGDDGIFRDVDSPEDYDATLSHARARRLGGRPPPR